MENARIIPNYQNSARLGSGQQSDKSAGLALDCFTPNDHYELQSDMEILKAIRSILHSDTSINEDNILINVEGGWVYLEGKVPTEDQRNLAMKLVTDIFGVTRVTNYLTFPRARFHAH